MRKLKNRGGFTLLEIIISIGVLAIVSIFVLRMFAQSINTEEKARDLDNAVSKASSVIEVFKTYGTLDPRLIGDSPIYPSVYEEDKDGTDSQSARFYYDSDWSASPDYAPLGFTIYANAPPPDDLGVRDITVSVVRHSAYMLELFGDTELYSLAGASYAGGNAYD